MIISTKSKISIAKFLYSFLSPFLRDKKRIIRRNKIQYEVDLTEGIDFSLFLFGSFQKHVIKNKLIKIPANAIIFDIGANVGLMTLPFAQTASTGIVYAFEPTHYALKKLKRNLELNPDLSNRISIINTFISDKTTANANIKAYSSWKVGGEDWGEKHPVHLGTAKDTSGVGSITLNDFCIKNKIERLDFIKIDTDGHEFEVFKGGKDAINKLHPQIIFEIGLYVMEEKNIDFSFYSNYFESINYKIFDSSTGKEITIKNYKKIIPAKGTIDALALPSN